MAAPTGTHKELPKAASKPKTLLALDGGGVKGISTLILLQAIMDEVKRQEGGEGDERKPVDYFDLAAGTSTGGLIALMLFRLHMSTSQVINVYHARAQDIFWPTFLGIPLDKVPLGHWLGFTILLKIKTLFTGQEFSNDGLKDVIDDVVKEYGLSPAERMKGGKADLVFDQSVGNEESGIGKTSGNMFMCATVRDKGECILLRSYRTPQDVNYKSSLARQAVKNDALDHIDITTAALATSAAPLYLPEVDFSIEKNTPRGKKPEKITFWDGGVLNNNPVDQLWDARYDLVGIYDPPPPVSFVLSIGCSWANPPSKTVCGVVRNLINKIGKVTSFMTNTEAKNRDFWRYVDRARDRHDLNANLHYLRLNAPTGDKVFDMADWKGMKGLAKMTEKYRDGILEKRDNDIVKAASLLINPESTVIFSKENGVPFEVRPVPKTG